MKLSSLNTKSKDDFLDVIGGPLEGERWLAERIIKRRPFTTVDNLIVAFDAVIMAATVDEQIRLIASHPDLAPKVTDGLSETSQREQATAGLTMLTPQEYQQFQQRNTAYRQHFGFPFVICAREHDKTSILDHFARRLNNTREQEIEIGIREVLKIIRLRLIDLIDASE